MLSYRINATIFEATSNATDVHYLHLISSNMFLIMNTLIGLLFAPLVNHVFIPCIPSLSMRGRMAVGMVINALAIVTAACIEKGIQSTHTTPVQSLLLSILPTVLITLPEVLTTMSGYYTTVIHAVLIYGYIIVTSTSMLYSVYIHSHIHALYGHLVFNFVTEFCFFFQRWSLCTHSHQRV